MIWASVRRMSVLLLHNAELRHDVRIDRLGDLDLVLKPGRFGFMRPLGGQCGGQGGKGRLEFGARAAIGRAGLVQARGETVALGTGIGEVFLGCERRVQHMRLEFAVEFGEPLIHFPGAVVEPRGRTVERVELGLELHRQILLGEGIRDDRCLQPVG